MDRSERRRRVVAAVAGVVAHAYINAADPDELDVAAALNTVTPLIDVLTDDEDRDEIAAMLVGAAVTIETLRPYLDRHDAPTVKLAEIAAKQLTDRELAVLETLAETEATPGELENRLVTFDPTISAFAVSRALSRLRFAGLVTERRTTRATHVQVLTPQGHTVLTLTR